MIISLIAAIGEKNELGANNDMLWHLPNEFRYFKRTTVDHTIVMGRKTFESFGSKALPKRRNVIVSRSQELSYPDAEVCHSLEAAIEAAQARGEKELFIIGGGEIYKQALPLCDQLYITVVHGVFKDATVFFPSIETSDWESTALERHSKDEKHSHDYTIYIKKRKKS